MRGFNSYWLFLACVECVLRHAVAQMQRRLRDTPDGSISRTRAMPTSSRCNTLSTWIRLSLEPELKPATLRKLLAHAGCADRIYALSHDSLSALAGAKLAAQMRAPAPP